MKYSGYKSLLTLAFAFYFYTGFAQTLSLSSAIEQKLVRVSFKATGNVDGLNTSSHIGKCVSYQMYNVSGKPLDLSLDAGYMFQPGDTTIQPLLFTDNTKWVLKAGAAVAGYLNAMCAALHKGSPVRDRSYSLGKMTSGVLKKFAQFVSKKQYQNGEAQNVLWAITNKSSLYGELDPKTTVGKDFIEFVKTEMKMDPMQKEAVFIPKKEIEKKVSVRVAESFNTEDSGSFTIKILDANGNVKLQQGLQDQKPGKVEYTFWISSADLPLGKYQVKYYINNKEAYRSEFELKFDE